MKKPGKNTKIILAITAVFLLFVGFVYKNNLVSLAKMERRINSMENLRDGYKERSREDSTFLENLRDNTFLEKYARENFYMKAPGEEIYLVDEKK